MINSTCPTPRSRSLSRSSESVRSRKSDGCSAWRRASPCSVSCSKSPGLPGGGYTRIFWRGYWAEAARGVPGPIHRHGCRFPGTPHVLATPFVSNPNKESTMQIATHPDQAGTAAPADRHEPSRQAFFMLHWGFVAAPFLAGIDKFFNLLTRWESYLAPALAKLSPLSPSSTMMVVGVIEMLAALIVAVRPRIGAYVVAAWLEIGRASCRE